MAVPDYQSLMRPLLALHQGKGELRRPELRDALAVELGLTAEDREERLPSGTQATFDNRVNWAVIYLQRAGLLSKPGRGRSEITSRGEEALADNPDSIDVGYLNRFDEFREFRNLRGSQPGPSNPQCASQEASTLASEQTAEEKLETAHEELTAALAEELLARLIDGDDRFFENVVLDVLVGMGYGGSKREAAQRVGRSGDGGIDGVIREDRLGLDAIYVQAKKWSSERHVGPREVREFIGALQDAEALKGVFLTTSRFSPEASALAERRRVVLIDGRSLAELMIETGVGVSRVRSLTLSRIDEDYFVEDGDIG
jgi:restriction system protein